MIDERLRELQRRSVAGSTPDEARYLLERLRVGDLALERLATAASCGDAAAALVWGEGREVERWSDGIPELIRRVGWDLDGKRAVVNGLCYVCREALRRGPDHRESRCRRVVDRVEAWAGTAHVGLSYARVVLTDGIHETGKKGVATDTKITLE